MIQIKQFMTIHIERPAIERSTDHPFDDRFDRQTDRETTVSNSSKMLQTDVERQYSDGDDDARMQSPFFYFCFRVRCGVDRVDIYTEALGKILLCGAINRMREFCCS